MNIALNETQSNCSNESIIEDFISKTDKIKENISAYENDLKEAKEDKKADKILKYNNKITEEKLELKQVESELSTLQ